MTRSASPPPIPPPLEELLSRLGETLGDLSGESVTDRLQPGVEGFFEQFQLVPRREYDAHMASLSRLERLVSDLENRVAGLEQRVDA